MADSRSSGIVVLGLGNPVLCDDAAGLHVVEALELLLSDKPLTGVCIQASTRAGFELLDMLQGYRVAVIVDAFNAPDAVPGRLRLLTIEDVAGCARLVGQHELSLPGAFSFAERMGLAMPELVEIYAIETAAADVLGEALTAAVAQTIQPVAQQIYARLGELSDMYCTPGEQLASSQAFYDPRG